MDLVIQHGVPIPEGQERSGSNMELLRKMDIGDSVFFDAPIAKNATRFYRVAKKLGIHILIRKEGAGQRMWRVAPNGEAKEKKPAAPKKVAKPKAKKTAPPKAETKRERDAKAKREKRAAAKAAAKTE